MVPEQNRLQQFFANFGNTFVATWTDKQLPLDPKTSQAIFADLIGTTRQEPDLQHHYFQVLEFLHSKIKPTTYLEIGVQRGESLRLATSATLAFGVDPEPIVEDPIFDAPPFYISKATSDQFFSTESIEALGSHRIDLAFIDGLHLFEAVLRDFIGTEAWSNEGGTITIHDVLPRTLIEASRHRLTRSWTGDVWRLIAVLRHFRPELDIAVLDANPTGIAVITRLNPHDNTLIERYEEIVAYGMSLNAYDFLFASAKKGSVISSHEWLQG